MRRAGHRGPVLCTELIWEASTCPSHAGHQHLAQSQSLVIFPASLQVGGGEGCPLALQSRGQALGDGRQRKARSSPNQACQDRVIRITVLFLKLAVNKMLLLTPHLTCRATP